MFKRIFLSLLLIWLAVQAISCAPRPITTQRDLWEERYQEYRLRRVIEQQSG
jgi:hypothetical protein